MTLEESKGPVAGKTVAWVGDGNNVAASWVHAAVRFGFKLSIACPPQLNPETKSSGMGQARRRPTWS